MTQELAGLLLEQSCDIDQPTDLAQAPAWRNLLLIVSSLHREYLERVLATGDIDTLCSAIVDVADAYI